MSKIEQIKKMVKGVYNRPIQIGYEPPTSSDTFQDIFLNVVKSLEDLQDLFKQYSPEERQVIRALTNYERMIRKMVTSNKSYLKNKDKSSHG